MDDKAYHLQAKAHQAVANAQVTGVLTREPCEECGRVAQAHHDSYYPDCLLKVRWLCGKHHQQWHTKNEAIWPTIFEYHPSDTQSASGTVRTSQHGKSPYPWYWKIRDCWFVTIHNKRFNLGHDRDEAFKRFEVIVAQHAYQAA
ncbi:hypothetical protein BH10PLA2_BH10PLA2_38800 [soil metagenome]